MVISLGPFGFRVDRAQVVDFTIPVYIDDLVGIIPFKTEEDHSILGKPFDWPTWFGVFTIPPAFLLILVLSDFVFHGKCKIWGLTEFVFRSMVSQNGPELPQPRNFNRVYTMTWILGCYVLATSYTGFF